MIYHQSTQSQLDALINGKPHAIVVSGSPGIGKHTIANVLMAGIIRQKNIANNPYILKINPEPSSVGIESVRKIQNFLSRKTAGIGTIRRIVLVFDAHTMTSEAQNALLKSIEEPPADTAIILTTDDLMALKATIRSRTQHLLVQPLNEHKAMDYFTKLGFSEADVRTSYYISDGRAGLMSGLLEQSSEHELVIAIKQAKELIKMEAYDRLLTVDKLSKQKEIIVLMLQGLERVISGGLRQAANKNSESTVKKFYKLSRLVQEAQNGIRKNASTKIALTKLFLEM